MDTTKHLLKDFPADLDESPISKKKPFMPKAQTPHYEVPNSFCINEDSVSQTFKDYENGLNSTYKHYSHNLYSVLDETKDSKEVSKPASSFKENFLLTSLSLTERIQITKKVVSHGGFHDRFIQFYIQTVDTNTESEDVFQSEGFSTEVSSSAGLCFNFELNPTSPVPQETRKELNVCAELFSQPFSDLNDRFLTISFKTEERSVNLGNLRRVKNCYQIFNSAGLPLYEIQNHLSPDKAEQKIMISDGKGETKGAIDFELEGLNSIVATVSFLDKKMSPKEKLLLVGAVFIFIGKVSWSHGKIRNNQEECSVGCFMGMILQKFCIPG